MKNTILFLTFFIFGNIALSQDCCSTSILEGWYYEQTYNDDFAEFYVHTQIHLTNEGFKILNKTNANPITRKDNIIFLGTYTNGKNIKDLEGNKWKYGWKVSGDLEYYHLRIKSKNKEYVFRFFVEDDIDSKIKLDKS